MRFGNYDESNSGVSKELKQGNETLHAGKVDNNDWNTPYTRRRKPLLTTAQSKRRKDLWLLWPEPTHDECDLQEVGDYREQYDQDDVIHE